MQALLYPAVSMSPFGRELSELALVFGAEVRVVIFQNLLIDVSVSFNRGALGASTLNSLPGEITLRADRGGCLFVSASRSCRLMSLKASNFSLSSTTRNIDLSCIWLFCFP